LKVKVKVKSLWHTMSGNMLLLLLFLVLSRLLRNAIINCAQRSHQARHAALKATRSSRTLLVRSQCGDGDRGKHIFQM
jgi:hypothetical protein